MSKQIMDIKTKLENDIKFIDKQLDLERQKRDTLQSKAERISDEISSKTVELNETRKQISECNQNISKLIGLSNGYTKLRDNYIDLNNKFKEMILTKDFECDIGGTTDEE